MRFKALPWQGFPGIFSSIDRYTKRVILNHLSRYSRLPGWMAEIGDAVEHVEPPHWARFQATDAGTGATLRGEADAIFRLSDGSCAIIDYKTSRYNPGSQGQNRAYRAQLNAYAWIAGRLDFPPVSRLALLYMEPATGDDAVSAPELVNAAGFTLGFRPRVVEAELGPDRLVPPLLRRAARIHKLAEPPDARDGCRDCAALARLFSELG